MKNMGKRRALRWAREVPGDRACKLVGGEARVEAVVGSYLQKPSMQILPGAQPTPWVGSHSLPRFSLEPHTSCMPDDVVTVLQMLKEGEALQAFALGGAHEM